MEQGSRYLTAEQVVDRAKGQGLDLSVRTLKFYVQSGLIPAPVQAPFSGADGRVRYFPVDILGRLRRIQTLKEQGFTLEQIQKLVAGRSGVSLRRLADTEDEATKQHPARRLLRVLASDTLRRYEAELRTRVGAEGGREEAVANATRDYYRMVLENAFPDEDVERFVDLFWRTAAAREKERLQQVFRRATPEQSGTPAPSPLSDALYRMIRAIVGALAARRLDRAEVQRLLSNTRHAVEQVTEKHAAARDNPVEDDIRLYLMQGLEHYQTALTGLEESYRTRNRTEARQALLSARRGQDILDTVYRLIKDRRQLIDLTQN